MSSAMETTARVSVVIPSYNSRETLEKAMQSVLNQSMKELELICVDDGSTDGTEQMVSAIAEGDPRVKVCRHERNRGILMARQTGTMAASSPFIMYLDADDRLMPEACERALRAVTEAGADAAHFGAEYFSAQDTPYAPETEQILKRDAAGVGAWEGAVPGVELLDRFFVSKTLHWSVWSKICKTELAKRIYSLIEDERIDIGEDAVMTFLLLNYAERVVYLPEKLYAYHLGIGITAAKDEKKARAIATEYDGAQLLRRCLGDEQRKDRRVTEAERALRGELMNAVMWNVLNVRDEAFRETLVAELTRRMSLADFLNELQTYRANAVAEEEAAEEETDDQQVARLQAKLEKLADVSAQEHARWNEVEQHYLADIAELKAAQVQQQESWAKAEKHYIQDIGKLKAAQAQAEKHYTQDIEELKAAQVQQQESWARTEKHYTQDIAELKAAQAQQQESWAQTEKHYTRDIAELKAAQAQQQESWAQAEKHYMRDIAELKAAQVLQQESWAQAEKHYMQDLGELKGALTDQAQRYEALMKAQAEEHERWAEMEQHYLADMGELKAALTDQAQRYEELTETRAQEHAHWAEQEQHYLSDLEELQTALQTETRKRRGLENDLEIAINAGVFEHLKSRHMARKLAASKE